MDNQITSRQLMLLVVLFTIGSSVLFVPGGATAAAKQDAWISILAGIGLSFLLVCMYNGVAGLYPGLTLVEISEKLLGKWLGAIVSFFLIVSTFAVGGVSLIDFAGTFVTRQIMPATPVIAANILFVVVAIWGQYLGLGTVARAAEVLFPLITALFIVMILAVSPNMKLEHLQPAFTVGVKPLIKSCISYLGFSTFPAVFFLMIYPPCVKEPDQASKAMLIGNIVGGLFLLTITTVCVAVLGAEGTSRQAYPSYTLAKKINIANFITRIEVLMATLWFLSLYFKLMIYFFAGMKGLAQLLKLQDKRALLLPLGLLSVVFARMFYPSAAYRQLWDEKIWPLYVGTSGLIIPLLLLAMGIIRKKGTMRRKNNS
ncbi:GerAB/ArcD/ProY family transporter [Paenibacillus elgii]|nr:endospore germination permease [Paenibacillus elgii]